MSPENSIPVSQRPRFSTVGTHDGEKVIPLPYTPSVAKSDGKNAFFARFDNNLIKGTVILILVSILVGGFALKQSSLSKDAYKNGFQDGAASLQSSLVSAQQLTRDQTEQISRLQNNLGSSNDNLIELQQAFKQQQRKLDALSAENKRMVEHLKGIKESNARRVGDLKTSYERKIDRIIQQDKARVAQLMKRPQQQKIEQLTAAVTSAQANLAAANKDVQVKEQLNAKLEKDIREFRSHSAALQRQINELRVELKAEAKAKADALAQVEAAQAEAASKRETEAWSKVRMDAKAASNQPGDASSNSNDAQTPYWIPEDYKINHGK